MPGVLIMDQDGADSARKAKDVQSKAAKKGVEGNNLTNGVPSIPQLDGPSDVHDDSSLNALLQDSVGQVRIPDSLIESWKQLPPELQHYQESFRPLSTLIERVAQTCYNGLEQTIEAMAARSSSASGAPVVNGVGQNGIVNGVSQISKDDFVKRTMLMNFARDQRDKLIKLMVLTQWARQVGDVSKMVDITNWLFHQIRVHEEATEWIGRVKLNMLPLKQSNPDIQTALEVLTTGRASWMPHLNYLPPKPLTPEKLLKTIRSLNALLAIRLNLEEEQPKHFRYSHIANGRATWIVPGEFEVDLSIAEEKPESQFFFIDIRFPFDPAPEIPDNFRPQLENMVNFALETNGLVGCYDTLHDLILTHKITILKQQALELRTQKWGESIGVESVKRSLIVQYWMDLPGPKSWIEIGVASGRKKEGEPGWRERPIPQISMRWFRDGVEVHGLDLMKTMNTVHLSMEQTLNMIVKLHGLNLLRAIHDGLALKIDSTSTSVATLVQPKSRADSPAYKCQLGASGTAFTLAVDNVTGDLTIRPETALSSHFRQDINALKNRSADAPLIIRKLLQSDLQSNTEQLGERRGWEIIRNLNTNKDTISNVFSMPAGYFGVYSRPGWGEQWALAATYNSSAEKWWVVALAESGRSRIIRAASRFAGPSPHRLSIKNLDAIERRGTTLISFYATTYELRKYKISYSIRQDPMSAQSFFKSTDNHVALRIYTRDLLRLPKNRKAVAKNSIHLTHSGLEYRGEHAMHRIKGVVRASPDAGLAKLLRENNKDKDVAFHPRGAFAFLLRTPFGKGFRGLLRRRILYIERLRHVAETLKVEKFTCLKLSLAEVVFTYGDEITKSLRAAISFREDGPTHVELEPSNPHHRVQTLLSHTLSVAGPTSLTAVSTSGAQAWSNFGMFAFYLKATLPLLRAFNDIQSRGADEVRPQTRPPHIYVISLDRYQIAYSKPTVQFDVELAPRGDEILWKCQATKGTQGENNKLVDELKKLFAIGEMSNKSKAVVSGSQEKQWWPKNTGIVATNQGIATVILKVNDLVRSFAATASAAPPNPNNKSVGAKPQSIVKGEPPQKKIKQEKDVIELD
ncbi:MAG: mediator complex subunit [Bogoriella megaspora]|nr:MAG: mediator complex subunit [Bogoriella megaspora]